MWRLTVEVPILSSSSAAAMPPQSATARNTRKRRKSMSLSWPSAERLGALGIGTGVGGSEED